MINYNIEFKSQQYFLKNYWILLATRKLIYIFKNNMYWNIMQCVEST